MGARQTGMAAAVALAAFSARGDGTEAIAYPRERYDLIVDRAPFGVDPLAGAEPDTSAQDAALAAAAAKALEKELRLCFLLESESGEVRAGFQNLKPSPGSPASVMLMVGESFRGMKLQSIDLPNAKATLLHNGKPVTFELTKGAEAAGPAARPAPPVAVPAAQRRFGGGFRRPEPPAAAEPEPQLSPEEEAKRREEVRENLRRYQMEVIRAGMPPLPIPLTQEMDDQLVAEGILPPE